MSKKEVGGEGACRVRGVEDPGKWGVRSAHDGGQDAPWEGHRWVAFLHVDIGLVLFSRKEDEKYTCVSYQTDTFQPPYAATFILQGRPSFSPVLPSALIPAPPTWPLFMPPCALWDGRQSLSQTSKLGWQPAPECAWKRRGKQGESCLKCLSSSREGGTCAEVCEHRCHHCGGSQVWRSDCQMKQKQSLQPPMTFFCIMCLQRKITDEWPGCNIMSFPLSSLDS